MGKRTLQLLVIGKRLGRRSRQRFGAPANRCPAWLQSKAVWRPGEPQAIADAAESLQAYANRREGDDVNRLSSIGLVIGLLSIASAAHAGDARHYDCSKPGNANKAACKAAPVAPAAATSAAPAMATAKGARTYDCSKTGNRTKAACKGSPAAAAPPSAVNAPKASAPVATSAKAAPSSSAGLPPSGASGSPRIVAWTQKNGKVVHYDCSKAGNFNKKACKS